MLAVTGANGHLGLRLLAACSDQPARALVRSPAAADTVRSLGLAGGVDVRVVDYRRADGFEAALSGCTTVIHLVGIIRENRPGDYYDAHEAASTALAGAAAGAGIRRIVYLSILGAAADAGNACLESRAAAEDILQSGAVPVTVIRVPMVLGEGDFAARALAARARRRCNVVLRAASLEQPIYAGDVVTALCNASKADAGPATHDLAGPESLTRRALIERAARVLGRSTRVVSLPLVFGIAAAGAFQRVSRRPPVTRAMLGVLDHDDRIDPAPAAAALGVRLTPLDETLRLVLGAAAES